MKIYIIAGEASGDLHGSNLIMALKQQKPDLEFRVWGGDLMQAAGGHLVKHYRYLAFMGFWEVLKNLRTIIRNLRFCQNDIAEFQPAILVLIDYPGFNLRIAKWAKKNGIRVVYYISPQLWAWHSSRVKAIVRDVDKMLVILPFEVDFYQKYGYKVTYVGHPLLDAIQAHKNNWQAEQQNPTVALLPGSRRQEVRRILPAMLKITPFFPEIQFVIAGASALPADFFEPYLSGYSNVCLKQGNTYEILQTARAALVKSGTSTLEAALIGTPQVVCYIGNPLSVSIARWLIQVPYISLVNLILNRPLVQELIQSDLNTPRLHGALQQLFEPSHVLEITKGYEHLRHILGDGGASKRAASEILAVPIN